MNNCTPEKLVRSVEIGLWEEKKVRCEKISLLFETLGIYKENLCKSPAIDYTCPRVPIPCSKLWCSQPSCPKFIRLS